MKNKSFVKIFSEMISDVRSGPLECQALCSVSIISNSHWKSQTFWFSRLFSEFDRRTWALTIGFCRGYGHSPLDSVERMDTVHWSDAKCPANQKESPTFWNSSFDSRVILNESLKKKEMGNSLRKCSCIQVRTFRSFWKAPIGCQEEGSNGFQGPRTRDCDGINGSTNRPKGPRRPENVLSFALDVTAACNQPCVEATSEHIRTPISPTHTH